MAGKLVQVDTVTLSSPTSATYLSGITTDDVYMVAINDFKVTTDNTYCWVRVGNSGTADSTANYDEASKSLYAGGAFGNNTATNDTDFNIVLPALDNGAGSNGNAILYLYNWANSSEYSFLTVEATQMLNNGILYGNQGGGVHTVAQSNSEIHFGMVSSTIASATFTLYRVV